MKLTKSNLLVVLLILLNTVIAQIPGIINYQAKIYDIAGIPLNGVNSFNFAIINNFGTTLWSADGINLEVIDGLYTVKLGDQEFGMEEIPHNVFNQNNDLSLRVWVNGEMLSDQKILPVPYAIKAGDSEKWQGNSYPDGTIWTSDNDGSGSGLDADKIDGMELGNLGMSLLASSTNWADTDNTSWTNLKQISIPGGTVGNSIIIFARWFSNLEQPCATYARISGNSGVIDNLSFNYFSFMEGTNSDEDKQIHSTTTIYTPSQNEIENGFTIYFQGKISGCSANIYSGPSWILGF